MNHSATLIRKRRFGHLSLVEKGIAVVAVFAVLILLLAFKTQIRVLFTSGDKITAEFSQDYGLRATKTKVKMGGLEVGVVTSIETTKSGTARVSMKVDEDALKVLGSDPAAEVQPLTVLGGEYAVELSAGGSKGAFKGKAIPLARTHLPVELDRVLESLPTDTRGALQGVVGKTRETLASGAGAEVRSFVADAPPVLRPAGQVFSALRGRANSEDLRVAIANVHTLAHTLSSEEYDLGRIATDLRTTTRVLASQSRPIAQTVRQLPATLDATDRGMVGLAQTLDRLTDSANRIDPTIKRLDPLLGELDPALKEALPVMRNLRPLLQDTTPLVRDLVPTSTTATDMLLDLKGPVLDRVNGPILTKLLNTWHGEGEYKNTGGGVQADNKFYEEIGYMITNLDRSSMTQDAQGSLLNFQAGVGYGTVAPIALDDVLAMLARHITGGRR